MIDYKKSSKQLALDLINEVSGNTFRIQDIELTDVKYLEDGIYNTEVKVVPAKGSMYQDSYTLKYDRINISAFFRGVTIRVQPSNQKLVSEYLPLINAKYGLGLGKEDIKDGVIPNNVSIPFRLVIEFKEDNPAFYGSFEILVSDISKSLTELLEDKDYRGIPYPSEDKDKISGPLYFYGNDWSHLGTLFSNYPNTTKIDSEFVNKINRYDNHVWSLNELPQPFNFYNSKVLYHGDNFENNPYSRSKYFDSILVVYLDEHYCTNVSGYLVFHYNRYHYN